MNHIEWATARHCSPTIHERGTEIGEHTVDHDYALSFDTGSAAVVVEGTDEELSDLLASARDQLNQLIGMRDGIDHRAPVIYDEPPF